MPNCRAAQSIQLSTAQLHDQLIAFRVSKQVIVTCERL